MPPGRDAIGTLRERGFVAQISDADALAALLGRGAVTFYAGFDPTAPSLHVGHMVPLMAMAHLARCGNLPIAVVGGGTALVGDPSGRDEARQVLTKETIADHRRRIEPQIRELLRVAGDNTIVLDNSTWLEGLRYVDFLREIGRHFSVNRMLAAEAYRQRLEKGLSFLEFNYQLLQAYDFLELYRRHGCVLQIGGDDQWGNMLAGADLIRRLHHTEAFALTLPLVTVASGAKMGKTAAGVVWLAPDRTSPFDFYQYVVNVDDRDVVRLLRLLTFVPMDEIARVDRLQGADLREAKERLALEVTRAAHGAEAAENARRGARAAFGQDGTASAEVPTHRVTRAAVLAGARIVDLLVDCGLAASRSAARRLVEQGAVRLAERRIEAVDEVVRAGDIPEAGALLHAGKKHVRRIVMGEAG